MSLISVSQTERDQAPPAPPVPACAAIQRPPVAWVPVAAIAVGAVAVLLALAGRYDYHRDELYFRILGQHPAWGYVDQPPLTPMLGRLGIALLGDTVWALRVPCALLVGVTAVLLALIAREVGGRTGAQALAAAGVASSFVLISGHTLVTNAPDLAIWTLVILFGLRASLRERPRYWLAAGLVVGLGLYNKHLVILLLASLGVGLLLVGPRRVLASRWVWAGAGIAVIAGSPNLVYQVVNGFPQLDMAAAIAENKGDESRVLLVPMQLLLIGPTLVPVWVAGIVSLLRSPRLRPVRALAAAYPVLCVLVFAVAGQFYYPVGLLLALYAIGCVPTVNWLATHRWRQVATGAAVTVNVTVSVLVALPVLPLRVLADTPIPRVNQVARDQIGWPAYVRQVADAYRSLPVADQEHTVIITGNYGEAGAIDRYGGRYRLPTVYSGQNELYRLRRPPDSATVVILVVQGDDSEPFLNRTFDRCTVVGELRNGLNVDNEEEGTAVRVCRGPRDSWVALWPRFQHYD